MKWEGTLEEFVQYILDGKISPISSHKRLYNALKWALEGDLTNQLFGMDSLIKQVMSDYLTPAAKGYDAHKRILVLVGPPGSGKSTFVKVLKEALAKYSQMDEGVVYRIKACPLNENPLLALPLEIKQQIERKTGFTITGFLSPLNQLKLREIYEGDWKKVKVEQFSINEHKREGIGSFVPGDPYSQEVNDLVGDVDFSTITKYGSISDPRAYRYDGEFQVANQGLLELHEVFKCQRELLYPFLTLAEEGMYKISRQSMVYTDQVVIGHTNEEDLLRYIEQGTNEAILSRMIFIKVPHNMVLDEEVKLYRTKLYPSDLDRLDYLALETLAHAVIMSRLDRSIKSESILNRVQQFNEGHLFTKRNQDGMVGVESRVVFKLLGRCMSGSEVITAKQLLNELHHEIQEDFLLLESEKQWYSELIERAELVYRNKLLTYVEDCMAIKMPHRLDNLVQQLLLSDPQSLQAGLGFDYAMYKKLQQHLKQLSKEEVNFSSLAKEYQQLFKQRLMQEYVKELYAKHYLWNWLNSDLVQYLTKKNVPYSNELINYTYQALTYELSNI
ncbi:hypothetical protein [Alkalibacillus silvisoli]|uniref:Serine/threonine protein kinase PrkA n=1 Tax=Alkalibacillus silvisoli TaxID=392823 RepID=A0ABN1A9D7_9BACI